MADGKIHVVNKRAKFEYAFLEKYEAGIQLRGTEVKSLRNGNASITDAYCTFDDGELYLVNAHIAEYKFGNINNHEPLRRRKLLLRKKELRKLEYKLKDKGLTVIPLELFQSDRGYVKLTIALSKGKKDFDKREDIKKRDTEREIARYT